MEKARDIIGKYLPFAWWVLLALFSICGIVAGAKVGGFFGISTIVVSIISIIIYAWQSVAEWIDKDNH